MATLGQPPGPGLHLLPSLCCRDAGLGTTEEDLMQIQEWLAHLISQPAADPLDWESYSVTMDEATWKAL